MISIRSRLRPFSHTVGMQCLLPGTDLIVTAESHRLQIGGHEIPLQNDPFLPFTLQLDLERNCVWAFGKGFRMKIRGRSDGFEAGSLFYPASVQYYLPQKTERLSLGCHKAQDWDRMGLRRDWKEILPFLFLLGQKVPPVHRPLTMCLEHFYQSSFHHLLVPQQIDQLSSAFFHIRSLFFQEKEDTWLLLPQNPFPEGRLLNLQTTSGSLDLEWTKGTLRRVIIHPEKSASLSLTLPPSIRSFRKRTSLHEKGERAWMEKPLLVESGKTLFLDQFHS